MPSLVERTRRARHHTTDTHSPDPATQPNPPTPATDPDRTTTPEAAAPEPDPAVEPEITAVQPDSAIGQPEIAAGTATPRIRIARTKISGAWVAVTVAAVGMVFLLIFILQNLTSASVHFLGANGTLPMGVAMLLAAVAGALLLALIGSARILQLRRVARRRG
jgi:uncharacterized integral membrane protein